MSLVTFIIKKSSDRFQSVNEELKSLGLDKSPFVLVSVIGQELLALGHSKEAVEVLECALRIGSTSLKLKQSVLSSLSSAYWTLGQTEKALKFMEQDLAVATALNDLAGEARAHANLGMVHLSRGNLTGSLNHYRHQLMLTLKVIAEIQKRLLALEEASFNWGGVLYLLTLAMNVVRYDFRQVIEFL